MDKENVYVHTMKYYSAIFLKKGNLVTCNTIDLEGIMLSKIRQTPYDLTYMWNLKQQKQTLPPPKTRAHRYREQTGGC